MAFETLNGGHFGEDAIFLSCDALSSLDLGLIVPKVHSPPPTPPPFSGAPVPGLGPAGWERLAAGEECQQKFIVKTCGLSKLIFY